MLQSMGSQRARQELATEQQQWDEGGDFSWVTESRPDFGPCSWPCLVHGATWTADHEPALAGPVKHISQHVFTRDGARPGGSDLLVALVLSFYVSPTLGILPGMR